MRTIYLALDYKCNHNCMICPLSTFDKLHKPLSMEDVKNTIEANDLGEGDRVVLSGGEPCLSALFFDTVKYIMHKGLGITMLSNVSCFADIDFVRQLEDVVDKSRFDIITALHSSDANLHDEITGCFESHVTSLAAIGNLIQHNFHVTIKHIISKKTFKGLPLLARMISDKYPPSVDFQLTAMDFCGRAGKNLEELYINPFEMQDYIEQALDVFEVEHIKRKITLLEFPFCWIDPYYWKYVITKPTSAMLYSAPNLENEQRYTEEVDGQCHTVEECSDCIMQKYCFGVWESAYRLKKSEIIKNITT